MPDYTDEFTGRVAVVTGAGQGIGAATAHAFARNGAAVVVCDRDRERAERVLGEIEDGGGSGTAVQVDVSVAGQLADLRARIERDHGRLDFACNNAGIIHPAAPLAEQDEADWDRVMAVNAKGVFLSMKHEIPLMLATGSGAIVNVTSTLGVVATTLQCIYTASKHAIIGLTKAGALDYAGAGIRVNAVAPGSVDTPLVAETDPAKMEEYRRAHPLGRIADPAEVAEAVLFLCSSAAANITGSTLLADGGLTAR